MIEYIVNHRNGSLIYQSDAIQQSNKTNLSVIKKLCLSALFTYDGYLKAVQNKFGKSYLIPVYINEEQMFIPIKRTRDYENIWINYAALIDVVSYHDYVKIIFESKRILNINISLKSLQKQIKYLEAIRNAKVKHFHF
ncbi:MAG: competence protein ComK [Acholeplasmataceae bacterium]|nr:competence protein ComK [Acholeplasmataceae bacterium]